MTYWTTIAQQGQGFNFSGLLQLVVIVLAFGMPAIGWIFKKVKEQAEIKSSRDRQRQVERDSLRQTEVVERVRPGDERAEQTERQRAMRDLAMRRQAQLQELRQRQLEAAKQRQAQKAERTSNEDATTLRSTPTPQVRQAPTSAPQAQPGTGGSVIPGGPLRSPQVVTPTQRRRQQVPAQPQMRQPANRPAPSRPPADRKATSATPSTVPTISAARRPADRLGVRGMFFGSDGRPLPHEQLRRALLMSEVLSKPISMRKNPDGHLEP